MTSAQYIVAFGAVVYTALALLVLRGTLAAIREYRADYPDDVRAWHWLLPVAFSVAWPLFFASVVIYRLAHRVRTPDRKIQK